MNQQEKQDITLAKGVAIILVVVGHLLGRGESAGNEWFLEVKTFLYLFHMPFFMFLSGYVFFRPGRVAAISANYGSFLARQSVQLLLPFIGMGLLILLLKLGLNQTLPVDNVPGGFIDGLIGLFWHTKHSPSMFIWYIFALYVFGATAPLLYRLLGERMTLWLVLGAALYVVPPIDYLYLNKITGFFLFFCIGGWLRQRETRYEHLLDRMLPLWLMVFTASLSLFYLFEVPRDIYLLAIGAASIPALHGASRWLLRHALPALRRALLSCGRSSYSIYLLNTLAIGAAKAAIFRFSDWDYANFFWAAPVLLAAGLLGPLLAERLVLRRIPFIRTRILGQ